MKILEKVLWPVDLHRSYDHTVKMISQLVTQFGNEIILLHVLPKELLNSSHQDFIEKTVKSDFEKLTAEISESGGQIASVKYVYGNVVECILDEAEKEDVNLILVGTGIVDGEKPGILGLNAQKIIRNARKPVFIVSDEIPEDSKHYVCPVDCSEPSATALSTAILTAKKTGSRLSVISVFESISINSPRFLRAGIYEKDENDRSFEQYRKEFEDFISRFDFLDLEYTASVLRGSSHEEIIKYARGAGLLFMGSTGKSGLRRILIGSVTERVAKEVPCSIVITKDEEVYKLRISTEIDDIDKHYTRGNELSELGYYKEALSQYKMCLQINDMHLPSIKSLSDLYDKLGEEEYARYYKELSESILTTLMNRKIEEEVRKHYRSKG